MLWTTVPQPWVPQQAHCKQQVFMPGYDRCRKQNPSKAMTRIMMQTLRPRPSSTFAFVTLRNKNSQARYENTPLLYFPCWEKKKIFKQVDKDSPKKEREVAWSYPQPKPGQPAVTWGWGFLTCLVKLWPSPAPLGPCSHARLPLLWPFLP